MRDEVVNNGAANWQGYVYRQLDAQPAAAEDRLHQSRSVRLPRRRLVHPGDKYEKRKYEDFADDGTLDKDATGGWIALLQHYFFTAWIPGDKDKSKFSLTTTQEDGVTHYVVRALGPGVNVAPGAASGNAARACGSVPKLVSEIEAANVPGLTRAVDFSRFSIMATLAGWLFCRALGDPRRSSATGAGRSSAW